MVELDVNIFSADSEGICLLSLWGKQEHLNCRFTARVQLPQ